MYHELPHTGIGAAILTAVAIVLTAVGFVLTKLAPRFRKT